MTPEHLELRPALIVEMFNELFVAHVGGTVAAPAPKPWEVEAVAGLMRSGVTFFELKAGLNWLFRTSHGAASKWMSPDIGLSTVQGFVNAWPAIAIRIDKALPTQHGRPVDTPSGQPKIVGGAKTPTAEQLAAQHKAGEANERPSDGNRDMYKPTLQSVPTGREAFRLALVETDLNQQQEKPQ